MARKTYTEEYKKHLASLFKQVEAQNSLLKNMSHQREQFAFGYKLKKNKIWLVKVKKIKSLRS